MILLVFLFLALVNVLGSGQPVSAQAPGSWAQVGFAGESVYWVATHPTDPQTLYASIISGVYRSTDGGESWENILNGSLYAKRGSFAINSENPQIMYVSTSGVGNNPQGSVLRSVDGGSTWSVILSGRSFVDVAVDPLNPTTVYAVQFATGGWWWTSHVHRSLDGGDTWGTIDNDLVYNSVYPTIIVPDPVDSQTLYAISGLNKGLWKTTDGGGSWRAINDGLSQPYAAIAVNPIDNQILYSPTRSGGLGIHKSVNGGISWVGMPLGPENFGSTTLILDPGNPDIVYVGTYKFLSTGATSDGVYRSTDGGNTWATINNGFPDTNKPLFTSFAFSAGSSRILYAATSNGVWGYSDVEPPIAAFTADQLSGSAPLTVEFTDQSTGNITGYVWNFGDGDTSTEQSPTHTYTEGGTYSVSLTVEGQGGSSSAVQTITVGDDDDGDGLWNDWETSGVPMGPGVQLLILSELDEIGIDIPPDPAIPDVYVWVDWLYKTGDHHHMPSNAVLDLVKDAFAAHNVRLHIVLGHGILETEILEVLGESTDPISSMIKATEVFDLRSTSLELDTYPGRASVFHYAIFGHDTPIIKYPDGSNRQPGGYHLSGTNVIVIGQLDTEFNLAATFMHELGHSLGLGHGGILPSGEPDPRNYKPNHLSIMNYWFSRTGIIKDGESGWLDYSPFGSEQIPDLQEEGELNEQSGLNSPEAERYGTRWSCSPLGIPRERLTLEANSSINWNCNLRNNETGVRADINGDNEFTRLSSRDEWSNLNFSYAEIGRLSLGAPIAYPDIMSIGEPDMTRVQLMEGIWVVLTDIKPGSEPNAINCHNQGTLITVALMTTERFDATTVDHTTVSFEGATEIHINRRTGVPQRHEEDVDGDGDMDLVFHFMLADTTLTCDSTEGTLTGETYDGMQIVGTDSIWVNPANGTCTLPASYWLAYSDASAEAYLETWDLLGPLDANEIFLHGKTYADVLVLGEYGSAWYRLGSAYIAAHLNQLSGARMTGNLRVSMTEAYSRLSAHNPDTATLTDDELLLFVQLAQVLNDYNNGVTGPGACLIN